MVESSPTAIESIAQQDKENIVDGKLNAHSKPEPSHAKQSLPKKTDEDPASTTNTLLGAYLIHSILLTRSDASNTEPTISITPGTPSRHSQAEQIQEHKPMTEVMHSHIYRIVHY